MKNFLSFTFAFLLLGSASIRAAEQPQITRVRLDGPNVVIEAAVPAGIVKVTLQSRDRVEGSTWIPRAVARLDGSGGDVSFTLVHSAHFELLRVRADETDPLPASFYQGTNTFIGEASGVAGGDAVLFNGNQGNPPLADNNEAGGQRSVVESDIWKIEGDTVYFFNTYRGLQVIDVTDPASPGISGSYEIPAVGEQMYLHQNHAILLARNGCGWWGSDSESRIVIVNVTNSPLSLAASLPLPGWIQESRMVGDVLYVAAQTYRVKDDNGTWEWGTSIHTFDLTDPADPISRGTLWFPGYGNTIAATDQYLLVVTTSENSWSQSILNLVDISSATGEMVQKGVIRPVGRIADKFKMNLNGDTLTIISHGMNSSNQWISILETFSIADPLKPAKLASLELAPNEQLHATRFDGNRVYIVTFFRIDPLWIVDLSDPAKPVILSELEVPGWSTYLHPMGDRLVAVGIEVTNQWKTTISLFDVSDPANPSLLDREFLGEGSSWSEANNDEKAFNVLEEDGLILVPYTGNVAEGYVNQVQLIDLDRDSLTKRGVINHRLTPRRATLHKDHVLSLSARELISVDAANRDQPELKADLALSWSVDQILLSGDYVIQVERGQSSGWNSSQTRPRLLVANKANPSLTLHTLELKNDWPIAGAEMKDGIIYLAQSKPNFWWFTPEAETEGETNPATFLNTIVDARSLPDLTETGSTSVTAVGFENATVEALWPKDDLLVWSGSGGWRGRWWWGGGIEDGGGIIAFAPMTRQALMPIWWGGGSAGRLLAFNIPEAGQAEFASSFDLTGTNQWWNISKAIAVKGGLVYASHQASEYLPDVISPWANPTVVYDSTTGQKITNEPPKGVWITRHFLDVVDFADPENPAARAPINIPGVLHDVSHDGAMIYTVYYRYDEKFATDYIEWVDALAYDDVAAHLVDSIKLPNEWPRAYTLNGGNVYIATANSTNPPPTLEHWRISTEGKFTLQSRAVLSEPAQNLAVTSDLLGVVTARQVQVYPAIGLGIPKPLGSKPFSSCVYLDMLKAQGSLSEGLWLPLADSGVLHVPVENP